MIEVYLAVSLLGIGYIFNKHNNKSIKAADPNSVKIHKPSLVAISAYDTNNVEKAKIVEQETVIKHLSSKNQFTSELLNKPFAKGDYVHNNMVPFFKGSGTNQNVDPYANVSVLEMYGVKDDSFKPKKEINPLFAPTENIKPITNIQDVQDRMFVSRLQNNVLPFKQEHVGPGLGKEFGSMPSGGFNPLSNEAMYKAGVLPKTVDDLRVKTNPKESYVNRVILGKKIDKRSQLGTVNTNENKSTFFAQGPERYLKTTGAFLKATKSSDVLLKDTHRKITKEYKGNPHVNKGLEMRSQVRAPLRNALPGFGKGLATLTTVAPAASKFDYGKGTIQVYANERDITSTKTYQGNITTVVKSIIAPIQDMLKRNKKEFYVESAREFGNMSIQIPEKMTVRDPNDVTRTTIKETTIHDGQQLNLKGTTKNSVYNPDSIARTTIKETLIHDGQQLNLKGTIKNSVYNPDSIAKTTIKETLIHDGQQLNLKGTSKNTVYNPDSIARTTLKETLIHDGQQLNLTGAPNITVYNPNSIARTTIKETLIHDTQLGNIVPPNKESKFRSDLDPHARKTVRETLDEPDKIANMKPPAFKQTVYDPDEIARKTIKETTLMCDVLGGVNAKERLNGGYQDKEMEAKITMKETYVDNDYYGAATTGTGEAYKNMSFDVRETMKENHEEYFGNAADQLGERPMDYSSIVNNATTNGIRASTLVVDHEPTLNNVKVINGPDGVKMNIKKMTIETREPELQRVVNASVPKSSMQESDTYTRERQCYEHDDRIDPDILEPFRKNPYTQPLPNS